VSSLFTATTDNIDNMTADERQMFGRFKIASSQIFYRSKYSFAMVNLRPLVPGHVLVVSNRIVPLLSDLDCEL
jgi:bis(5'-adenosyl)-triphosphatase